MLPRRRLALGFALPIASIRRACQSRREGGSAAYDPEMGSQRSVNNPGGAGLEAAVIKSLANLRTALIVSAISLVLSGVVGAMLRLAFIYLPLGSLDAVDAVGLITQVVLATLTALVFVASMKRPWPRVWPVLIATLLIGGLGGLAMALLASLSGACQVPIGVPSHQGGRYVLDARSTVVEISAAMYRRYIACETGDLSIIWGVVALLAVWRTGTWAMAERTGGPRRGRSSR
jgi:hypothetical protein